MTQAVSNALSDRWAALAKVRPGLRIYDAAEQLDVAEARLLLIDPEVRTVRLRPDWANLLACDEALGEVMALTRNRHAVHERHGVYRNLSVSGAMGLFVGEQIDLRLFLSQWRHAYAVFPNAAQPRRPSLQFFDAMGRAVHKIHATPETNMPAWHALVDAFADSDADADVDFAPPPVRKPARPDSQIDAAALRAGWESLKDTHDFFGLLKRLGAERVQAMRLVGEDLARPLAVGAVRRVLEAAATWGVPIMVFVGNAGCIQIHTGPVERLKATGDWFNVLDPAFNLHLRETGIASTWLVRKPTADGVVTSVEAFDEAGETIAMLFGKRKPGESERADWRTLTAALAES
ncbi:MAG: hemin-degrading factor [Rhodospirillales bacterium]|jgi:putative hemin transport protein